MDNRYRISILLLIAVLVPKIVAPLRAQQPQEEPAAPKPTSAAVLAILETDPSTPAEWVEVAKILADLDRPDLGKKFLRQALDARLNQQQLADLAEKLSTAMFVEMAARTDMLPEARQLSDAVLAAANKHLQDPKRLAALIQKLQDPSPEARTRAVTGLREARSAAIGPMIDVLADPGRAGEHGAVRAALVGMRSEAIDPLLGILERSDPKLMAQAIRVLAQLDAKEAAIYLLGPYASEMSDPAVRAAAGAALTRLLGHVPTRPQAIRLLTDRAKTYFDRGQLIRADLDGQVDVWSWDAGKKQCVSRKYLAEDAVLAMAARLARDAYALAKDDPEIRRLYLATMLEAAAYETGLDEPLQDAPGAAMAEAGSFGVEVIENVLEYAVAGGHMAAATAAAQILGQKGTATKLLYREARPAPLVRAIRHPDRRLRLAATAAVVRLQPARPFAGSSYVAESLAFFAASGGVPHALVASPNPETSQTLAGMLAQMRLDVDTAATGRELIRRAVASPDYEVALIDVAIEQPGAGLLLQQLRHDCRSATLRVGLFARSGQLERARQIADRDPLAMAFSRPHTDAALAWQIEQLRSLAPRRFVPHALRQRQAAEALDLLAEISRSDRGLYDLRQIQGSVLAALSTFKLSTKAAAVLGNLGTPQSQRGLVELASRWTLPLETRMAAVEAFRQSTQRQGILLTSQQIARQYERYNQSGTLDEGTQRVLGLILDCIEAPTQIVKAGADKEQKDAQEAESKDVKKANPEP